MCEKPTNTPIIHSVRSKQWIWHNEKHINFTIVVIWFTCLFISLIYQLIQSVQYRGLVSHLITLNDMYILGRTPLDEQSARRTHL
jgi:hypothetical protein